MATLNKCRVCFCNLNETSDSYDMQELPALAHKFVACTDLNVSQEERLPTELCSACHDQLQQFYAFRAKCIAADTKWRMEILAFCKDEVTTYELDLAPDSLEAVYIEDPTLNEITEGKRQERKPKYEIRQVNYTVPEIEFLETEPDEQSAEEDHDDLDNEEISTQQQSKIHKCDVCAAQFLNKQRLQSHKRRHGKLPYPCTVPGCDRGYSHKNTLSLHLRKCHKLGKEYKSHVCEYCGKVFDSLARLKNHRFTHKDKSELPYACEEPNCEQRFSTKEMQKVHMMRHAGIKNYTCSYCGVQKTTRTELKIHLNHHTLERKYCCRFCSKVCYSSSNLNKHMRTVHEGVRNHACSYCERTFNHSETRKQHELIHTGEKPHQCTDCGRYFRQKAALRAHYKIHKRELNASVANPDGHADDVSEFEEVEYELC